MVSAFVFITHHTANKMHYKSLPIRKVKKENNMGNKSVLEIFLINEGIVLCNSKFLEPLKPKKPVMI